MPVLQVETFGIGDSLTPNYSLILEELDITIMQEVLNPSIITVYTKSYKGKP
jgi:hypothetical protein